MTISTAPAPVPTPAPSTEPERTHRYIGHPLHGPCLCGKPYASPVHHEQGR